MPQKILIIENDESLIELSKTILRKRGFVIDAITNVGGITDYLQKNKPDLIILDNLLSGQKTGLEVCHDIKSHSDLRSIPILLTTGQALKEEPSPNHPPDDYLHKPFEIETFLAKINKLLKK